MKRSIGLILALLLLFGASAEEARFAGATTVTLTVPSSYTVHIRCGAHGGFSVNGTAYTADAAFTVQRERGLEVTLQPQSGYVAVVTASTDVGVSLSGNTLLFGDSLKDITVSLTFEPDAGNPVCLNRAELVLSEGMRYILRASTGAGEPLSSEAVWTSSNAKVAAIKTDGTVTAMGKGTATISVSDRGFTATCEITVREMNEFQLLGMLTEIEAEGMMNDTSLEIAAFSDQLSEIGDRAFAGCTNLRFAVIPSMTATLGEDCFEGCTRLTIVCPAGSTAESYASQHGIDCQIINQ